MAQAASLKATPLTFEIDATGGKQMIVLENTCKERIAFKVKTTNVEHYKMSKIFGFIDVGKSIEFQVTRSYGPARADRLVLQYVAVPPTITDPAMPFNKDEKGLRLISSLNIFVNAVTKTITAPAKEQKIDESYQQTFMPAGPPT